MTLMKRSRSLSLLLISSLTLVSCAEQQQRTSRALYDNREDCEREWGTASDTCYNDNGYHYGPHFLYFGGRGFYYPYRNGVPGNNALAAPASAQFSGAGALQSRGIVRSTNIARGGFGVQRGFGFGG